MKEADCNGNIRNSKEVFTPHTSSGCHCQTHDKKHPHHFSNSESHEHSHSESEGAEKLNVRTFIGSSISLLMLILGLMMSHFDIFDFADNIIFRLIWYIVAFLPVGLPVMKEAIEGIIAHDFFNEFTLMSIACIGAFCIKEFPEAVGVMLFYSIGENLQDYAVGRATKSITKLLDVQVRQAVVIRNGRAISLPPEDVGIGELIEVKPGQRVPLDGLLESEIGTFDTSALTGESVPRIIERGGEVLSGMIALDSTVRLRVNHTYSDSALSRILDMVKNAQGRKAHAELFIRKFARIYTPIVILLAILIVIIPLIVSLITPSFHYAFTEWLYRALVFLVISCPCALVISVPLGYFAGIGAASRKGILFKGGNYLEAVTHITTVAFDKTGTLTTGQFSVEKIECVNSAKDTFISLIASAESGSTHPLAKAIVNYAHQNSLTLLPTKEMKEIPGFGAEVTINGSKIIAGNLKLLTRHGIKYPAYLDSECGSIIAVAINGEYAGVILLADTIKQESKQAIEDLDKLHVRRVVMLSGDKKEIVSEYAKRLGINEFHGEMLPSEKAEFVETESNKDGEKIAFVGDGMNDAPVLAVSDVGIAMGGLGSDVAIESADIVIQTDNPQRVATAIRLGRYTHKIVKENIIGAISIKIIIMILGGLGIATLWGAVFADVGVALLAVLNSMRIMRK